MDECFLLVNKQYIDFAIAFVISAIAFAILAINDGAEQVSVCVSQVTVKCVGVAQPRHRYSFTAVKSCCSNPTLKISVKLTPGMSRRKTCK